MNKSLRGIVAAVSAAVLFIGLGSCGLIPADESPISVVTYQPEGVGGQDGVLQGVLATLGGCLVVEEDDGTTTVPFFPRNRVGYTQDGGVRLFGSNHSIGDTVSFRGGSRDGVQDASIPEPCEQAILVSTLFTVAQER